MLGPQLPRRRPARPGDRRAEQAARARPRRARDPPHPRQPVPREGAGRPRHPDSSAPAAAAAAEPLEHAYVLLCLGLDYRRGGFVDRAIEAFQEVLRLDPDERARAGAAREAPRRSAPVDRGLRSAQRLTATVAPGRQPRHSQAILAFLENEIGLQALRGRDTRGARALRGGHRHRSGSATPAYLNLGDIRLRARRHGRRHRDVGALIAASRRSAPTWCSIGCEPPMSRPARRSGSTALCRRLIDANPQDWRARLALAAPSARAAATRAAPRRCSSTRSAHNPHALLHAPGDLEHARRPARPPPHVERYVELTPRRRLLPRSAHLPALPLPQHRAALAVPALPRVEHVRRGAARRRPRRRARGRLCRGPAARGAHGRHRDGQEPTSAPGWPSTASRRSTPTCSRARPSPRARSGLAARGRALRHGRPAPDGGLDRRALGVVVFADAQAARRPRGDRSSARPRRHGDVARSARRGRREPGRRRHPAALRDGPRWRLRSGDRHQLPAQPAGGPRRSSATA